MAKDYPDVSRFGRAAARAKADVARWGPWLIALAALGVAIAAWSASAVTGVNPVDVAVDVAESPFTTGPCPSGWQSDAADDEHTVVTRCMRGVWTVWLNTEGEFDHAWDSQSPNFIYPDRMDQVPDWLQ